MRAVIRSPITLRVNRLGICKRTFCKNVNIIYPTQHSTSPNHLQEIVCGEIKNAVSYPQTQSFATSIYVCGDRSTRGLILF